MRMQILRESYLLHSIHSIFIDRLRRFFGSLAVGTPPVSFDIILDTGSSYVPSVMLRAPTINFMLGIYG